MGKNKKRKIASHTQAGKALLEAKKPSAKKTIPRPVKPTIPFAPEDRILLVGEGDFSFAKSIVEEHGCFEVTATCFDSQAELFEKYKPQAEEHVHYLEEESQTVVYGVDATKLDQNKTLKSGGLFDRILFNFPHVGGKSKDVNRQVRFNQELLVKFFAAAKLLLLPEGTIVVTLFEGEPYTLWNIKDLARHSELQVQRSFRFVAEAYPGYSHARTLGNIEGGGGWKGEDREARTFIFEAKPAGKQATQQTPGQPNSKKRKKAADDDSENDG